MSENAAAPAEGKKRGNMPLFAVIAIVLVLNVVMVGKIFLGGKEGAKEQKPQVEEVGVKMNLDEFLVNLSGSADHYLKATIALGLKKGETEEKLKEDVAPIRDAIIAVLAAKTPEDLTTETGREKLKTDITSRANKAIGSDKIVKVYFTSFATQ